MFSIQAKIREKGSKLSIQREVGDMPAVYYSAGKTAISIFVPFNEFKKIWRDAGEASTIQLKFDKGSLPIDVLIHDVQVDPVKNEPVHADFLVVDINKPVEVNIPLEFIGIAPAVKSGVGSLVKVMHEIEVEALPRDLPQILTVDISKLIDADSQILVSDITIPVKVTVLTKLDDIVASIALQKEEKEEVVSPDLSAIEVEKKGKKEEEVQES